MAEDQPPADPIKVHVFLHSHLDLGWIYTLERYYQGSGGQDGGCVKCAFNNVYDSLEKGTATRKYLIAEVGFFNRWWQDQSEERRARVREYVKQGKIEFVSGGWGTNDEAAAYYEDIIDQFALGHRWLKREFGVDPNVGWQLDSFGHSATHASLMAQAGYDAVFFGRLDYQDWDKRRKDKTLEFHWRPSNPHNESTMGRALYVHYSDTKFMISDNYWCRSIFCNGNLNPNQFNTLTNWLTEQAKSFRTKNIAMLVGDDFHLWQGSEKDFVGIEDMIEHYKSQPHLGIEVKFSGLTEYIEEVQKDLLANKPELDAFPEHHGDFMPYVENEWTSWSGYFTSKSMFKHRVRQYSQWYNAAKLLLTKYLIANNQDIMKADSTIHGEIDQSLDRLEQALAVIQHHDGVSGTNKEYVREDYDNMLNDGRKEIDKKIRNLLANYAKEITGETLQYTEPMAMDLRQEDQKLEELFKEQKKVLVSAFNPGEKSTYLLKIRVPSDKFKVLDENNNFLVVDIICNTEDGKDECFIYFADELPAYSLKSYILVPSKLSKRIAPEDIHTEVNINLDNHATLKVDPNLMDFEYKICPNINRHDLSQLFENSKCIEDSFNIDYEYYHSENAKGGWRVASGAYVFNPREGEEKNHFGDVRTGRVFRGHHLTMVQIFRDRLRTDIRLVHHELELGIEIESHLNGITDAHQGMEIVMKVTSKTVQNKDREFFTDSNGYYMLRRQTDWREDFESHSNQPVAANYFPITSAVYVNSPDTNKRLTIMSDRAQGVASLHPGEIEIMIHRICIGDDWKGLGEILNEHEANYKYTGALRVSTRHFLMLSSPQTNVPHLQRKKQYKLDRSPQFWFTNIKTEEFLPKKKNQKKSTLDLQDGIKVYARSYKLNEYVIRLQNTDEVHTKMVDIFNIQTKLCTLLNGLSGRDDLELKSITELSLFTHKPKSDVHKNKIDPNAKEVTHPNDGTELSKVELVPMEIRTFNIVIA